MKQAKLILIIIMYQKIVILLCSQHKILMRCHIHFSVLFLKSQMDFTEVSTWTSHLWGAQSPPVAGGTAQLERKQNIC